VEDKNRDINTFVDSFTMDNFKRELLGFLLEAPKRYIFSC
jgi:hypothetical protein